MAHLHCEFFSDILGQGTGAEILLPEQSAVCSSFPGNGHRGPFPVLYLLHGYNGNETVWTRYTALERYAGQYPFAVIMPRANHSYYADSPVTGYDYFRFLTEELPEKMKHFFNISDRRDQTVIAGLSMGGFGAVNCALKHPERYCAAASLSGMLDPAAKYADGSVRDHCRRALGTTQEQLQSRQNDTISLLIDAAEAGTELPHFYVTCGREDSLFPHAKHFSEICDARHIPCDFVENSGEHEWDYWDRELPAVLHWLNQQIVM